MNYLGQSSQGINLKFLNFYLNMIFLKSVPPPAGGGQWGMINCIPESVFGLFLT